MKPQRRGRGSQAGTGAAPWPKFPLGLVSSPGMSHAAAPREGPPRGPDARHCLPPPPPSGSASSSSFQAWWDSLETGQEGGPPSPPRGPPQREGACWGGSTASHSPPQQGRGVAPSQPGCYKLPREPRPALQTLPLSLSGPSLPPGLDSRRAGAATLLLPTAVAQPATSRAAGTGARLQIAARGACCQPHRRAPWAASDVGPVLRGGEAARRSRSRLQSGHRCLCRLLRGGRGGGRQRRAAERLGRCHGPFLPKRAVAAPQTAPPWGPKQLVRGCVCALSGPREAWGVMPPQSLLG